MSFSAVILAGGKSSRMGRDKARLQIGGQPLLARQIELARRAGAAEILVSGREDYSEFGCRVLEDRFPNAGPLAGIERALAGAASSLLLVLAVDLPSMNAEFLRQLASHCNKSVGAIPRLGGHIEPLAAYYPTSAWSAAESLLTKQSNAAHTFAEVCVETGLARFVDVSPADAGLFANCNTPGDLDLR